MKKRSLSKQMALKIIILIAAGALLFTVQAPLPDRVGTVDFRPYWSASYLLAHGQDFSDLEKMDTVERTLTGWDESYTMQAWFAPTGHLLLLFFTLFPFKQAAYYWLLLNIVVVFSSALLIWPKPNLRIWIPFVAAFGFSMTLLSLIYGQVNTLVLFGLVLFLYFSKARRDYAAGAALVLTTIKPHLVIFTLPLLLLDIVRRKQWRVLAGFAGVLGGCALILFTFYPAWPISFWQLVTGGMDTIRETPTLSGLFVVAGEYTWGKWIWVIGLLVAVAVWWRNGQSWDRRSLIDVSILAGTLAAPIGWSYDQVMLLFPILRVLEWAVDGSLPRKDAIIFTLLLILMNAVTFYERSLSPSEVWFFWVSLAVALIYGFAWWRKRTSLMELTPEAAQ